MGSGTVLAAPAISSARGGMGALPFAGGVTFRVWAKFAPSVAVVGDFNRWDTKANPLAPDGSSGYWSADVPGAVTGQEYLFYIPGAGNGGYRMDPYARSVRQTDHGCHGVIASSDTGYDDNGYTTPRWNEAVIYELHIPTFTTAPDGSAGTLKTACDKLADLADMGINAIEIMPLGEFTSVRSTGYNPGYIFAVEDTYGGPDAFRGFVNEAHRHGIAVILDVVYNHLWGTDLWQFDGWFTPGSRCPFHAQATSAEGGIYFYQDWRSHTDFGHTRFDFGREEVLSYVVDNVRRWMEDRFVDGLRLDSVVNIRGVQVGGDYKGDIIDGKKLLQRINRTVQESQGWKITIAEDLQSEPAITTPVESDGFGFNAQWDNEFWYRLCDVVLPPADGQRQVQRLAENIAARSGWAAFRNVIYSETHDRADPDQQGGRVPERIHPGLSDSWESKKRSTLAAAVVMTAPGIPMIFQGQEFLEYAPFLNDPFKWPQQIDWGLRDKFWGIRNLYRDLMHLRRNWYNNTRGLRGANVHVLPVFADNVLVYHRWDAGGAGDDVVVVCNFSSQGYANYVVGFPQGGLWRVRFNSDSREYDMFFGDWHSFDTEANGPGLNGMPCSGNVGVGPYSCVIYSQ